MFLTIIGTVASVAGLGISIYLIFVTQAARDAARDARSLARKLNLVEELENASQKIQQVGSFIQQDQWVAVRLRSEEILSACQITLSRWPDHLTETRKNEIITASGLIRSIAMSAANHVDGKMEIGRKKKVNDAHIRASAHISSALGEARRSQERDGDA
jgi:hypothetical protein